MAPHKMKILTCKDLGGTCEERLSADSWNDIVKRMTNHVMQNDLDVAQQMEEMHHEDPQKWGKGMKPKWEAAPET